MIELRGSDETIKLLKEAWYGISGMDKEFPPKELEKQFPDANSDALDLLKKMLIINPEKRITIENALKHPFLNDDYNLKDKLLPEFNYDSEEKLNFNENDPQFDMKIYIKNLIYKEIDDWNKNVNGFIKEGK